MTGSAVMDTLSLFLYYFHIIYINLPHPALEPIFAHVRTPVPPSIVSAGIPEITEIRSASDIEKQMVVDPEEA